MKLQSKDRFRLIRKMMAIVWESSPQLFILVLAMTILQSMIPVSTAWILKTILDQIIAVVAGGQTNTQLIVTLIVIQSVLLIVSKLFPLVQQFLNKELTRSLEINIQTSLYGKINNFSGIRYFESPEFHDLLRLSNQGAQMGPQMMVSTLMGIVRGVTTLASFIIVIATLSVWMLILLVIVIIPQLLILMKIGGQRFSLAFKLSTDERRNFYYAHILSADETAGEIRLFGLGDYLLGKLVSTYKTVHSAKRTQDIRELRLNGGLESLSTVVHALTFSAIIFQAVQRMITIGDVTLYNSAIQNVQGSLREIVSGVAQLNENALFFSNYERLLALPQPISIPETTQTVPELQRGIQLNDVWFRYDDELPWILQGVNLFIPAGSCLALVGLNGAGKSTIVKLLTRMYDPTKGEILWDGVNINQFDPAQYRQHLGTVFQDFVRYDLTARENIGLGDVTQIDDMDAIREAAQKSGVADFIEALPEQYDTILSRWLLDGSDETGTDLSGGQWQRIAIARTFMRQADLMILDEPTAALDAEAEYDMYDRFTQLIDGRTSFLISHRFSTVCMADCIAVLSEGVIVEQGSHTQLMGRPHGIYAQLYRKQAERYGDPHHNNYDEDVPTTTRPLPELTMVSI